MPGMNKTVTLALDARDPQLNGSSVARTILVGDVRFKFEGNRGKSKLTALTVTTPTWKTTAEVTKGAPHWGLLRIDITVHPLYATSSGAANEHGDGPVAPHGVLGQVRACAHLAHVLLA